MAKPKPPPYPKPPAPTAEPPPPQPGASMPCAPRKVLGADLNLNRLGSRGALSPEALEPIRRQLGVAHRVLDVLVPKPGL
jgi:hypothetical protein